MTPLDWYDAAAAASRSITEREHDLSERRSFSGPKTDATKPPKKPYTIFEPKSVKAGRIENTDEGEVIRWTSDHCYQILVTPNEMHRGMTKCFMPLGKRKVRGDLFNHMKDVAPPPDPATDVP